MSDLTKYIIERLQLRFSEYGNSLIDIHEGTIYSTLTQNPSTIEINWEMLQKEMDQFEAEFKQKAANSADADPA